MGEILFNVAAAKSYIFKVIKVANRTKNKNKLVKVKKKRNKIVYQIQIKAM